MYISSVAVSAMTNSHVSISQNKSDVFFIRILRISFFSFHNLNILIYSFWDKNHKNHPPIYSFNILKIQVYDQ